MTKPCIIVAGMGRCGTSLMMQMLHRAGAPCIGSFPAFETEHSSFGTFEPARLAGLSATAIKIIDPKRLRIPVLTNHVVIWLDRDPKHQAASSAKLIGWGENFAVGRHDRRRIEKSLRQDRQPNLRAFSAVPMLVVRFDDLITSTKRTCSAITEFLSMFEWDLDPKAMAAAVVPRGPECLPYMLEEYLLLRGAA